jgi:hypothetical protein
MQESENSKQTMHIVAAPLAKVLHYDHIQAAHIQVVHQVTHHTRGSLAAASQAALVPTNLQHLAVAVVVLQVVHDIPDTLPAAAQEQSFESSVFDTRK